MVRVHADLGNGSDADRTEDDIITRFTDILSGKSLDEASRILAEIELKVIAAKKGHSVVLYVYCRTATELIDLFESHLSGKLRNTVEQLFRQLLLGSSAAEYLEVTVENLKDVIECTLTQLFYRSQIERLAVTLPTEEEYKKYMSYFSDGKYNEAMIFLNYVYIDLFTLGQFMNRCRRICKNYALICPLPISKTTAIRKNINIWCNRCVHGLTFCLVSFRIQYNSSGMRPRSKKNNQQFLRGAEEYCPVRGERERSLPEGATL